MHNPRGSALQRKGGGIPNTTEGSAAGGSRALEKGRSGASEGKRQVYGDEDKLEHGERALGQEAVGGIKAVAVTADDAGSGPAHQLLRQVAIGEPLAGNLGWQVQAWEGQVVGPLSAGWSDYYMTHPRTPQCLELAPWVAPRYQRRRERRQRNQEAAAAAQVAQADGEKTL